MLLKHFIDSFEVEEALDSGDEELLEDIVRRFEEVIPALAERFNAGNDWEVESLWPADLDTLSLAEAVANVDDDVNMSGIPTSFIEDQLRQDIEAFDIEDCASMAGGKVSVMTVALPVSAWVDPTELFAEHELVPPSLSNRFYEELESALDYSVDWPEGTDEIRPQSAHFVDHYENGCVTIEADRLRELRRDIARDWIRDRISRDPKEAIKSFLHQLEAFEAPVARRLREHMPTEDDLLELAGNWAMADSDEDRDDVAREIHDYLESLSGSDEPPEILAEYTKEDLGRMGIRKGTLYENAPWVLVRLPPAALRAEGVAMKHCVGDRSMGYVKAVADGDIEIWSLRRASDMKPRFTLEVDGAINEVSDPDRRANLIHQVKGKANRTPGFAERRSSQVTMPDEVIFWANVFNRLEIDPYDVEDMRPGMTDMQRMNIFPLSVSRFRVQRNAPSQRRSFDEPYRRA